MLRIHLVAEGRAGPGQQAPRPQVGQPSAPHPLGDEATLVLRDRAPDLQEELIVRIMGHGAIDEDHRAAVLLEFLDQEHLMDVFAGQAVRRRQRHHAKGGTGRGITQAVKAGTGQPGSTVPLITIDVLRGKGPPLRSAVGLQALQLLFDGLGLRLPGRRDPHLDCGVHQSPPEMTRSPGSTAEAAGRRRPSGARPSGSAPCPAGRSTRVSCASPRRASEPVRPG